MIFKFLLFYIKGVSKLKKSILYFILLFTPISCGTQTKSVQHDDSNSNNQAIVFSQGWGKNYNYPITIDLSSQINQENSALIAQVQNAINTWNSAIGRNILTLRTGYEARTGNNFIGLYTSLQDNTTGLYYDEMVDSTGGWVHNTGKSSSILATTIYDSDNQIILSADIRFNKDGFIFGNTKTDSGNTIQPIADMESIALHELGHVLGLGHVITESNSVMYPFINIGSDSINNPTTARCLSQNDITRIRSIYTGGNSVNVSCISP